MVKGMYSAAICCFQEIDVEEIFIGCMGKQECLCCQEACCIAANTEAFPIGLIKEEGMLLKVGLLCCTMGIKIPTVLCLGEGKCLCCRNASAFPFAGPVPEPVCAICCLSLLPTVGFMVPAPSPKGPAGGPVAAEIAR